MLVLSRKKQESVVVTSPDGVECLIRITVIEIRDGRVRLGIEAASHISVHRMEVWERIQCGGVLKETTYCGSDDDDGLIDHLNPNVAFNHDIGGQG